MSGGHLPPAGEPGPEEVLRALRLRLIGSPQLRHQPVEDISHDLMHSGYLRTQPDTALVGEALKRLDEELSEARSRAEEPPAFEPHETEGFELPGLKDARERTGLSVEQLVAVSGIPKEELERLEAGRLRARLLTITRLAGHLKSTEDELRGWRSMSEGPSG